MSAKKKSPPKAADVEVPPKKFVQPQPPPNIERFLPLAKDMEAMYSVPKIPLSVSKSGHVAKRDVRTTQTTLPAVLQFIGKSAELLLKDSYLKVFLANPYLKAKDPETELLFKKVLLAENGGPFSEVFLDYFNRVLVKADLTIKQKNDHNAEANRTQIASNFERFFTEPSHFHFGQHFIMSNLLVQNKEYYNCLDQGYSILYRSTTDLFEKFDALPDGSQLTHAVQVFFS
jgi:hypothetical protein